MNQTTKQRLRGRRLGKFEDPLICADGAERAEVVLTGLRTLWFNTGTLCNIACVNCYIDSSPTNDALAYLTLADVTSFLDELETLGRPAQDIGFTGGEPFMNPDFPAILRETLARGYRVLVLTNAMRPMQRSKVWTELQEIISTYRDKITFRVSMDHFDRPLNDQIRGDGSYDAALAGLALLNGLGAQLAVACRIFDGSEAALRAGFARFFAAQGLPIDAHDPTRLVLFPEMDETAEVPEITTACWGILDKDPAEVMCASSRMVVRRRGAGRPAVIACTLLPHVPGFELGHSLAEADRPVRLNHPHCARFCILGGASCST